MKKTPLTTSGHKHWFRTATPTSSAIHINGVGLHEHMSPGHVNRPVGTGDWLLMMLWEGSDLMPSHADTQEAAVLHTGPVAMLWPPHAAHYYGRAHTTWDHSWLHVMGSVVDREWHSDVLPHNTPFPIVDGDRIESILHFLVEECQHPANPSIDILTHGFQILTAEIARQVKPPEASTARPLWLQQCLDDIAQHYDRPVTLPEAAQRANLSVPRFCALFKQHTGNTLIKTVWKTRMEAALYQLGDHNRSISDVAAMVGVPDIFQFSKQFKRYHGQSPRAWRKANTN